MLKWLLSVDSASPTATAISFSDSASEGSPKDPSELTLVVGFSKRRVEADLQRALDALSRRGIVASKGDSEPTETRLRS